jgi:membrane protein
VGAFDRITQGSGFSSWAHIRRDGRDVFRSGARTFVQSDLLSYASAISFQIVYAAIPLILTGVALLAFLGLEEVWRADLAPRVREGVRGDAYSVINRAVEQVLGEKRLLWLTFGAAFALWQISGAVRATMSPLNVVFGLKDERSTRRRFLVSLALALEIAVLVISASFVIQLGPRALGALDLPVALEVFLAVARWGLAVALLSLAVWLLLRYAPAKPQSFAWAGVGSVFVVGSWLLASLGFGFYATRIADYGSVFGTLASVLVALTYVYVSSTALLFGIQLDACVRELVRKEEGRGDRGSRRAGKHALSGVASGS